MSEARHVTIITKFGYSYEREAFAGIGRYASAHANWELHLPFSGYRGSRCQPRNENVSSDS
jgi:hypothetical protein